MQRAARAFARAKRAMILIGSALGSPLDPKEVAIASSNLALISGHLGKESSGILLLLEKCNSQGAMDMGIFHGEGAEKGEGSEVSFRRQGKERSGPFIWLGRTR